MLVIYYVLVILFMQYSLSLTSLSWGIGHIPPFVTRSKPLVMLRVYKAFLKVCHTHTVNI